MVRLRRHLVDPVVRRVVWLVSCLLVLVTPSAPVVAQVWILDSLAFTNSSGQTYLLELKTISSGPWLSRSPAGVLLSLKATHTATEGTHNWANGGWMSYSLSKEGGVLSVYYGMWYILLGKNSYDGRDYLVFYPAIRDLYPTQATAFDDWSAWEVAGVVVQPWVKANFRAGELPFPITGMFHGSGGQGGNDLTVESRQVGLGLIPESWPTDIDDTSSSFSFSLKWALLPQSGAGVLPSTQPTTQPSVDVSGSDRTDNTLIRPLGDEFSNAPGQLSQRLATLFGVFTNGEANIETTWAGPGGSSQFSASGVFTILDQVVLDPSIPLLTDASLVYVKFFGNAALVLCTWFYVIRRFADASGKPDMGTVTETVGGDGQVRTEFSGPRYSSAGGKARAFFGGKIKHRVRYRP